MKQPLDVEAKNAAQTVSQQWLGQLAALGRTSLWIPALGPGLQGFHADFRRGADIGSPGRIRATETLGLDTSHFVTEDTLLNKINDLKSMFSYQAGWEWNHFSRTAHTASGPEGFSFCRFWTAEQKESVASLQIFQKQLLVSYFTIKK